MSADATSSGKVPFGLKDGILYEPSQVERGSACKLYISFMQEASSYETR